MRDPAVRPLGQQIALAVANEAVQVLGIIRAHDTARRIVDQDRGRQHRDRAPSFHWRARVAIVRLLFLSVLASAYHLMLLFPEKAARQSRPSSKATSSDIRDLSQGGSNTSVTF